MCHEDAFSRYKDPALRHFQHEFQNNSNGHAKLYLEYMLGDSFTLAEKIRALQTMTLTDLKYFSKRVFEEMFVEILVHGNISSSQVTDLRCRNIFV